MKRACAVVPAYNEETRLAGVLNPLLEATLVGDVIVVDDGSADGTAAVARRIRDANPRVRLVELPENLGKGGAMRRGAVIAEAETILFLDADLIGLRPEQVDDLVRPVLEDRADMTLGVFRGGRGFTDLSHFLVAWISGQRALRREAFLAIPGIDGSRAGVETAITRHARAHCWRVAPVVMPGVTHTMKEEKLGFLPGARARLRMYREIARALFDAGESEPVTAERATEAVEAEGTGASG